MKRKVLCFVLTLLAIAVFSLGCGGGGGHSNPASPITSSNAKVSGVVVDSSKKPVADVRVRLVSAKNFQINSLAGNALASSRFSISGNDTEFNTITDKNGYYSFENVPLGRYSLSVDAGEQGALMPNLNVSLSETAVSELTITPFGFVSGTVEDENGKKIYGAMVNAGEHCAFTNNTGDFTLSHIPVGVNYELVTTLQGYEPTGTTEFTIPSDGDLTLTLSSPIVLKPDQTDSYNVPATVTATITSFQFPVFIIAEDPNSNDNLFFGILEEGAASCTLKITKAGSYKVFAISSDPEAVESQKVDLTVTKANISGNATNELVSIPFDESGSEERKVNIVKVTTPEEMNEQYTIVGDSFENSYYDGYVSDYAPGAGWVYSRITDYPSNSWEQKTSSAIAYGHTYLYGNSVAYYNKDDDGGYIVWKDANDASGEVKSITLSPEIEGFGLGETINMALIPEEYFTVGYQYNCASSKVYLKVYNTNSFDPGVVTDNPEPYATLLNGAEGIFAYDFRMAKDNNGDCYLAVLYSDGFNGLRIYNISTLGNNTNITADVEVAGIQPDKMKNFKVLKDASGNLLFYVEGGNSMGEVQSYIVNSSSQIVYSDTSSSQRSCYIDGEGNMYRYVPPTETTSGVNEDSRKIIKITSPFNSNQSSATTTLDLTESSSSNEEIDGILGFEENASDNTLTIYVH